jgi:hypothetical protein
MIIRHGEKAGPGQVPKWAYTIYHHAGQCSIDQVLDEGMVRLADGQSVPAVLTIVRGGAALAKAPVAGQDVDYAACRPALLQVRMRDGSKSQVRLDFNVCTEDSDIEASLDRLLVYAREKGWAG